MKRKLIFLVLLSGLLLPQTTHGQKRAKPAAKTAPKTLSKAADKMAVQAQPFPLTAVRLLSDPNHSSPFYAAMLRDQKYLLALDSDRLLHMFRVTAGLPSTAKPLGGWEAPDVELRGHSLGHVLSALALMYASTGDARFKTKAAAIVAELAQVQTALAAKGYNTGYLAAFPEEFFERVEKRQRVWAPYYTIHKIMAGLLDVYQHCGNAQALDVLKKKAAWVKFRVDRLSDEQQQAALQTEFGGMMEVLENLYAVTGNADYQRLARKFDHQRVLDPLARGEDLLNGLHANTQIPKAIGAARDYELSGEQRYHDIATFFWERVVHQRSFVIGGNSDGESFFPPETTSKHLGAESTETCNTYNMLKLTRHLFAWKPAVEQMDFYERGLYNHILASQDPATGGFCYYVPLKPGAFKTYSTADDSFWCCVGTGMENHAKYPDTIYFHGERDLYVNLFIASELNWKEQGLSLRQETSFPEADTTKLTIKAARPVRLALKLRYPNWAQTGVTLTLNGKPQPVTEKPGSYITLERLWKTGDVVQLQLPMSLRFEAMPDDPTLLAVLYGPIVLAGDLGRAGLDEARRYGPSAPLMGRVKPIEIPGFVGTIKDVLPKIQPIPGAPLIFKTVGLAQPHDVTLLPFYRVFEPRYTVYWKVYPPTEWDKRRIELAALEARRQTIERQTLDAVDLNDPENERAHNLQGDGLFDGEFDGKRWRSARNGWLSYDLKVESDKPLTLVCTFRGSEGRLRAFDILVDGERVATQTLDIHPGELFDYEYALPAALTHGKQRLTVKFQARPNAQLASIFDVRVAQLEK